MFGKLPAFRLREEVWTAKKKPIFPGNRSGPGSYISIFPAVRLYLPLWFPKSCRLSDTGMGSGSEPE